jgi:hypothetical protein
MRTITQPISATTVTPPIPGEPISVMADQRIVIRDLDWDLYERLSEAIGARQNV